MSNLSNSPSPREQKSKNHHHSIQELFRHISKKVHLWPRKSNESTGSSGRASPRIDPEDEYFRSRSKSLDVNTLQRPRRILEDCGATYKIFDRILKEGNKCEQ